MNRALLAVGVWVVAASIGIGAPAFADTADTYEIIYETDAVSTSAGPDGVENAEPTLAVTVRLVCTETECLIAEAGGFRITGVTFDPRVRTGTVSFPGKDTACDRDQPSPGTFTFVASASDFAATYEQPPIGWSDCGGGTRQYTHSYTTTWVTKSVSGDVCILEPAGCVVPTPTPTPELTAVIVADAPADPQPASVSSSLLATGSPAAPSVLSSLATPATAGTAPGQLLLAAVLTVILVLLVAIPTSLLNSAAEAGSDRLSQWRSRRRVSDPSSGSGIGEGVSGGSRRWTHTWWWAGMGVLAASVISSFVDPGFGFNAGSARVVLSILVSFGIDVVIGWFLVIWLVRRLAPEATHAYVFQPLTLLVVVAAVLFTRMTGFEPGIVFGLVAGVAFGALTGRAHEARAALTTLGYAFGVAVVAWIGYGMLGGGAAAGDSFGQTFVIETLASVAIGGMAALPIALFPFRGLAGATVWRWSRAVWAACYAVGLFAFFVVLMPMPFSWEGVGWDLWTWLGVYLVYAVGAVVTWGVIARPWRRESSADAESSADTVADPASVPADRLEE